MVNKNYLKKVPFWKVIALIKIINKVIKNINSITFTVLPLGEELKDLFRKGHQILNNSRDSSSLWLGGYSNNN